MGRILFCVVIAYLACGCRWKAPPHAPEAPAANDSNRLPEAASGKPIEDTAESDVLLNVNGNGEVVPPSNGLGDSKPLLDITQVEDYLRERAETERMLTSKGKPEGLPILRIDRDTPFEKTYPILKACRTVGYEKCQLRVRRTNSAELQLSLRLFSPEEEIGLPGVAEQPSKYIVRVTVSDAGEIVDQRLREAGRPDEVGESLGSDAEMYRQKLTELATAEKKRIASEAAKGIVIAPPQLTLELPDKLPHASVVSLLDAALQAGFAEVWLLPIDPAKR